MTTPTGIHHVTAIGGDAGRTYDFYTRILGLRFVKKTVNFDDPRTYHLYFGDEAGSPGTAMTFFPWGHAAPGRPGAGQACATAFLVPEASLGFWLARFTTLGVAHDGPAKRFGQTVLPFRDPDGLGLELVFSPEAGAVAGWAGGPVAPEHALRGFAGVTIWLRDWAPTADVLTQALGFTAAGVDGDHRRFVADGRLIGRTVDLRVAPGLIGGRMGVGSVHHVAFRVKDDAEQQALADTLSTKLDLTPTPQQDRNYFRSIYFREPGGVLFEIATDSPGFTVDEPLQSLGGSLKLPPFYEPRRAEIESALPDLAV